MKTVALLILSNLFMTIAWYGHLRFKHVDLWQVILVSWLIALPEYALQVPANRYGHGRFTAAQLKAIQEVVSLTVFCLFSLWYLGETVRWNYLVGFALIAAGAYFVFLGRDPARPHGGAAVHVDRHETLGAHPRRNGTQNVSPRRPAAGSAPRHRELRPDATG